MTYSLINIPPNKIVSFMCNKLGPNMWNHAGDSSEQKVTGRSPKLEV